MGSHAGNALHYHGAGTDRYGHHHYYLSIMHEHEPGEYCKHGNLARSCEMCELEAENERLRALLARVLVADTWDEIREISAQIRAGAGGSES